MAKIESIEQGASLGKHHVYKHVKFCLIILETFIKMLVEILNNI